ncbi:MAG: hypothetical protein ACRDYE_10710 [Acidimicrobiales bacterium]
MSRRQVKRVVAGAAVIVLMAAVGISVGLLGGRARPVTSTCTVSSGSQAAPFTLTPDQAQNAVIIAAVGLHRGMPDHAVTVALAAALQESHLLNLSFGDRDSLGLFQQRPSEGWGTPAQILDPAYAAAAFYDHLVQVPGWVSMSVTEAAQLVQGSADPGAYAQWGSEARALAVAATGEQAAALTCELGGFGGAAPGPGALAAAAATEIGPGALANPSSTKAGWQAATWAVAHAYNYHLTSVSYDGRQWTWGSTSTTWSPAPVTTSVATTT